MRGNKMIGILWIVIALSLTAILLYKINGGKRFSFGANKLIESDTYPSNELNHYEFEKNQINSVDIKLAAESLIINKSTDNKIHVELHCPEEHKPTVGIIENTLKIQPSPRKVQIHGFAERKVIVKLPEGLELSDFDIDLTSGSLQMNEIKQNQLDAKSSSGSIHMSNCQFTTADLKSVSGSVNLENCNIETIEAKSTSGSVKLSGNYTKMELHSVSGSIHAQTATPITADSDFQTTSGSIHLSLPSNTSFNSIYSCISGTYHNNITGTTGKKGKETVNNGGPTLELQTTSGSIHIN